MNHVLHEGVHSVMYGWLPGLMTVVCIAVFIGWGWYALSRKNDKRFEEAANLPLTNGDDYE